MTIDLTTAATTPATTAAVPTSRDHDVIGIGIGPFNLGLAALADQVGGLDAVFFDARPSFSWHPGLMLEGTTLQVPFLADLVTMADPTNPWSFLNYLHRRGRLFRFFFYERFLVPRAEFDAYCRWVAESLTSCRFGHRVRSVRPDGPRWIVEVEHDGAVEEHAATHVVMGVGTAPYVPPFAEGRSTSTMFHSSEYLAHRDEVLAASSVTVVGSGQSAGEVFCDLLSQQGTTGARLDWFTRSRGFLPMEYSKLGLEHFSPEYTRYFHGLDADRRDGIRSGQDLLYKGLSAETSARIYDLLYERTVDGDDPAVGYRSSCEVTGVRSDGAGWELSMRHRDAVGDFCHRSDVVVLATGYRPRPLPIVDGVVATDGAGRPVIELDYRVRRADGVASTLFVQNAELHTHGVGAPDLTLGAHRNAVILNEICGKEIHPVRERNVFQSFGLPETAKAAGGGGPVGGAGRVGGVA